MERILNVSGGGSPSDRVFEIRENAIYAPHYGSITVRGLGGRQVEDVEFGECDGRFLGREAVDVLTFELDDGDKITFCPRMTGNLLGMCGSGKWGVAHRRCLHEKPPNEKNHDEKKASLRAT